MCYRIMKFSIFNVIEYLLFNFLYVLVLTRIIKDIPITVLVALVFNIINIICLVRDIKIMYFLWQQSEVKVHVSLHFQSLVFIPV